jgi:hypothetical protein
MIFLSQYKLQKNKKRALLTNGDKYTVINVFLLDYHTRLREWHKLRDTLQESDLQTICVEVDKFWQRAPLLNHYLHPADTVDWPGPWELLSDNEYCLYARGLGMVYTLLLLGVKDVDFVDVMYDNSENVCLVLVDNAKYVLNWYPNSVLNTSLSDFTNIKRIDINPLTQKIGKE